MSTEELIVKSVADKKCSDLLDIVRQILIHAPDMATALSAVDQVAQALQEE